MGKKKKETSDEILVRTIVEAIQEKKGKDIVKLDLKDLKNTVCDCFIICQGDSNTQVRAIADNIEKQSFLKLKEQPHHIEGRENSQWILIDFFSVVVHIFQAEQRNFYKLEDLWSDGKMEIMKD
jgi:ribosome-associated protein